MQFFPVIVANFVKSTISFRDALRYFATGSVYLPYIPVMITHPVVNFDDYAPRRPIMTRYARQVVRPEYYTHVQVRTPHDVEHIELNFTITPIGVDFTSARGVTFYMLRRQLEIKESNNSFSFAVGGQFT